MASLLILAAVTSTTLFALTSDAAATAATAAATAATTTTTFVAAAESIASAASEGEVGGQFVSDNVESVDEPLLDTQILPRSLFPGEREDFRAMRKALRSLAERSGKHGDDAWEMLRSTRRAQNPISPLAPFPCNMSPELSRSPSPPTSVHQLRPGDIDVVAAMGDSLTAGNGVLATNPLQVYLEERGVAFPAGGDKSWRDALTVPNILKEFNPKLRGYSDGTSFSYESASRLNVAEPAARSTDMLHQAKLLVRRVRADKEIDFDNHWKLVTLMVGANDACHVCYEEDPAALPAHHAAALVEALDYLRDHLPRTLVSVIVVPDVLSALTMEGRSAICGLLTVVECPCLAGRRFEDRREQFHQVFKLLQAAQLQLGSLPRYIGREDFAVEVQPWTTQLQLPRTAGPGSLHDLSIFSADCFHFSQRGNALAANALWNNMMEPSSRKSHGLPAKLFGFFRCPSQERPFLATYGNANRTLTHNAAVTKPSKKTTKSKAKFARNPSGTQ